MKRNEKGQLIYANEPQFDAAQEANRKSRIARNEYAARLKDAPHAQLGKKIKAGRSKGAESTSEKAKRNHVEIVEAFRRIAHENKFTTPKKLMGHKGWIQDRVFEYFNVKQVEIKEGAITKTETKTRKKKGFSLRVIKGATARL